MKSWFTAFLSRSTVGVSPARRFKTPFLGIAIFLAGLAASGVALRAQTVSTFASGFSQPTALAFDAAGNLYVTNAGPGSNTVSKVTSGGGVTQFANGFSYPNGLACDTAGNLYVANYIDGTVSKVTSGGSGSTFASGFNGPVGLACDAAGNLYVANRNGGTVSKVTSGGSITVFASGLTSPTSLAFDAAGNLYVSSSATTVSKIPSGGGAPTNFATAPYEVYGMVFDAAGNLYLVSRDPGIVSKITPGGSVSTVVSGLSYTDALARDAAGNLYVASDTLGVVSKITLPTPSITGISPTSGAAAGGTSVVITGTNFTGVTAVTFGATAAASYTFNSATQITATSPGTSAGTVHITVTTADGTSATSAADQFTFVNAPPSVGNLEGDSVTFTEGGSAVKLDTGSNATVTDTDSANFNGGNVTVSIAANRVTGEDVLSIRHQGTGAGEIGVSGGNVTYAGTTIGTFAGGAGTSDLVVTLNANATPTNVGALLRNLTYANTNTSDPSTSARTVRVTVNDGDGGTSTAADVTVTVTAVNDAPTLTATGLNPTFGEGGPAIDLFGSVIASTGDSGQTFAALTLIVTNVANGANEFLSIGGTDVALTSGNSGTLTGLGSFSVSVAGGTATVSVTGLTRSSAQMATLVDGLAYRNTAAPPNTTARVVTLTGIQDNGGTANGGVDSAALSVASTVSIDLAPTLSGRSEPGAGTYIIGQALNFTVSYSENVTVNTGGGTPYLAVTLATGGSVQAPYASGTGTTTLTFRYTVASGHLDADGIAVASAITLNGGTIKDSANLDAPTTSLGFGSTTAVLVDGVAPTLASSNRQTPAASATNATSVLYRVTFAEAVTGVDSADFTLTPTGSAGGTIVSVNAVSSTVYDVTVNAISGAGTLRLDLKNAGTGIADLVGNGIATGYTSGQTYTIDTTAAVVTSVSAPAAATYVAGQNLDFTVNWDENVTVDPAGGTPTIALTVGSTNRSATYQSGSGSTALVFRYTTQAGDVDADGPAVASAIALHGGTIKDSAGNDATLTLNSVGSTAAVLVDALAPTVTGTTVPANGTYKTGQHLDFTVTYSENVTVVGAPYVAVTLATGGTVQAAYQGGTGTTTLTFRSTVASGNLDADGIAVASAITLNGGTIKDATGNDAATTSLGFAATTGVLVDGVAPTVASIGRQAPSGASTNATSVTYRVTFAEAVTGVDTADFALTTTGTAAGAIASLNAVSGTVYDVTVNTISGAGTLRLDLNSAGTGIADAVTNAIATGFTTGETYTIDNTAPTLSTIARQTPTTVHTDTATATWRVTFAEDVTGVDATDFTATAVSGTGSGTVAAVTPVSATAYDVVVNLTGQARLRLDLKSTGTGIADLAGNALADGGFTTGDFYLTGITSVFDTSAVTPNGFVIVAAGGTKVAQRFRTAAGQPLTLSSVTALLKTINGTPSPVVQILADNAGAPGSTVITTLTNPASLTADALNVWTGSALLTASTTYWVAFSDTSASASYEIQLSTVATTGGTGTWLTSPTDYKFHYGASLENSVGSVLKVALGATSTPAISSSLTASATVGAAFSYQTEATNTPSSYTAAGLPSGLSLNGATGAITGTPTQAGTFNVTLRATNASGTGPDSNAVSVKVVEG